MLVSLVCLARGIKMLSDKWLCVPRHGTMTDWPITRHKGGKHIAMFIKALWMLTR